MWFLYLVTIVLLLLCGYYLLHYWVARKVVDEHGNPVPCAPLFSLLVDRFRGIAQFERIRINVERYGKVHMGLFLVFPCLTVSDANMAKQFLHDTSHFTKLKTIQQRFSQWFSGYNVVRADGADWRRMRACMDPAFVQLDKYVDIFASKTKACLQTWNSTSGTIVPIYDCMQRMTLDILGQAIFGYDFQFLSHPNNKYLQAYHGVFDNISNLPYLLCPWLCYAPTNYVASMVKNLTLIDEMCYELIQQSKARIGSNSTTTTMLDMMVEATKRSEQGLSDKELYVWNLFTNINNRRDNLIIFLVAGHESTATSLAFTLYLLAKHPHVQQHLVDEIHKVKDPLTFESLQSNAYLNAVIKESLRMYPPFPFVPPKKTIETLKLGDYTVHKGTYVQLSLEALHNDTKYWKEPEKFRPERWLNQEECKMRHPYCYLPFSGGPRVCIGNNFSLLEQRVFLTHFLLKFKVELPEPNYQLKLDKYKIIMSPKQDTKLRILQR